MESGTDYLVEVDNLWKVFGAEDKNVQTDDLDEQGKDGRVVAVRDVSLQVKSGEVFVIMGLSGSGKSTLIRCLCRLIEPGYGRVIVHGKDVTAMNRKELIEFRRTQVAMVFQHYGLLPHRTVLENVAFGLKLRGVQRKESEEKAAATIQKVGLEGWEKRYPAQLSGGMQQRVGIARALVQDTDLLLLDEPFSGLDPLMRRELQEELLRLQNDLHKTMVFVTHDLNEALRLGDRMAVMKAGVFVQVGSPQDIVMNPADDYVQRFVQDEQKMALMIDSSDKKSKVLNLEAHNGGRNEKTVAVRR